MRAGLLAVWLVGCGLTDRDKDGFLSDVDCDDRDAEVNPEGVEVCDGVDNDCDGSFGALACDEDPGCDEPDALDALLWFADFDEDGLGDPDRPAKACEQPIGWVDNDDDCDDAVEGPACD
jgi:hypothetical protein